MDAPIPFDMPTAPPLAGRPYDQPPMLARERRLHARAYQFWASLRGSRDFPAIADLDPRAWAEFAPSAVLVELGRDTGRPVIHAVGTTIAADGGFGSAAPAFEAVPRASLLGQLIRRLPTVRDRGAPVSFEADFAGADGSPTHYRGILLPFTDAGGAITFVYGVISWKLVATEAIDANVAASLAATLATPPSLAAPSPWASSRADAAERLPLAQQLAAARTWAALAEADPGRGSASLVAALSAAHDLRLAAEADPQGFASLSAAAGSVPDVGIGAVVRLVFGRNAPRVEQAQYMAVLFHARRLGFGPGMLLPLLERHPGGAVALAAAERRTRRLERRDRQIGSTYPAADAAPLPGRIAFAPVDAAHLLLLAQRGPRLLDHAVPTLGRVTAHADPASRRVAAS